MKLSVFAGKFSLPQRELYEATLAVQKACIALCTTTRSLDQIYRQMLVLLGVQLQKIGVLPRTISATDLVKVVEAFMFTALYSSQTYVATA